MTCASDCMHRREGMTCASVYMHRREGMICQCLHAQERGYDLPVSTCTGERV